MNLFATPADTGGCEFWHGAERQGWLMKQGAWIKTWRRRWFVLKDGKLFWFLDNQITPESQPRGVIEVAKCLSIKGAEDAINKPHSFELATQAGGNMYFIADQDKDFIKTARRMPVEAAKDKEDWINAVGRAIVKHSRSLLENEQTDYTSSM